jgi:glutamate dehydrogenase (NADP+)
MRFCQSFMTALYQHVGPTIDVPAGDIGVSGREIGYMYGQYKRLTGSHDGVLTGKGVGYGGSYARKEATGYGIAYFAENMLASRKQSLAGKTCVLSGSGNVAIYTVDKLLQIGAKPVTVSDSQGMICHTSGIDLAVLKQVKEVERAPLSRYKELCPSAEYTPVSAYPKGRNAVWGVRCDVAFPCATQNELNDADAKELLKNGCQCVVEGSNMPCTLKAIGVLLEAGICYGPSKAANAGGVSTSQLEMAQNASMQQWSFEEVDAKLQVIMKGIFNTAHETAIEFNAPGNLLLGANIAGFRRVADGMIALGVY